MSDVTRTLVQLESGDASASEKLLRLVYEHHPLGFSSWMAGGGVKPGIVHGATDELGMNAVDNPVHVRHFHATILHLMGLDHERLSSRHAGFDVRLTGVEHAHVVKEILA